MHGKSIMMVLCMLICFSCHGQNVEPMEATSHKKLYPYLGENDLYGYADLEGNILIEPQYVMASFFQNNVAIVRTEGEKEILIDRDHQPVSIPLTYNELRQHSFSHHTIIELTETYTNRWRFWEWRFLPDFSFFGTPSRNRLFDTEVMREKRSLYWLEGARKIQSKKGGKGKGHTYFYLNSVDDNVIQVDDQFYRIEHRTIKPIVKNVKTGQRIAGGYYLQKKGSSFQVIDSTGRQVIPQKFIPQLTMELDIEGIPFTLTTESYYSTHHKLAKVYKDDKGNHYIYPDLSKRFPLKISPYPFQDSITAMEIVKGAQSFTSIPDSDRFLIVLNHGKRVYAIDTAGNWQNPDENMAQITVVTRSGHSVWPPIAYELGTPSIPDGWNISDFYSLDKTKNLFKVHIRNEDQRAHGLWDKNTQTWMMSSIYYQIGYSLNRNRFLSFQKEKDGKWGFYDLENQQVHIPPTYRSADGAGWVSLDDTGGRKRFYLDVENKREFREK